jgi:hypothetical protein
MPCGPWGTGKARPLILDIRRIRAVSPCRGDPQHAPGGAPSVGRIAVPSPRVSTASDAQLIRWAPGAKRGGITSSSVISRPIVARARPELTGIFCSCLAGIPGPWRPGISHCQVPPRRGAGSRWFARAWQHPEGSRCRIDRRRGARLGSAERGRRGDSIRSHAGSSDRRTTGPVPEASRFAGLDATATDRDGRGHSVSRTRTERRPTA